MQQEWRKMDCSYCHCIGMKVEFITILGPSLALIALAVFRCFGNSLHNYIKVMSFTSCAIKSMLGLDFLQEDLCPQSGPSSLA